MIIIYWCYSLYIPQENILLDPMFDVPGSDIVDVIVDGNVVRGDKKPQYVRRPTELSPAPARELHTAVNP